MKKLVCSLVVVAAMSLTGCGADNACTDSKDPKCGGMPVINPDDSNLDELPEVFREFATKTGESNCHKEGKETLCSSEVIPGLIDLVDVVENSIAEDDLISLNTNEIKAWGASVNTFGSEFVDAASIASSYVYSPFSLHSVLSMTAYGAKGTTYDEMADVLNLDSDKKQAAKLNGGMRNQLRFDGQTDGSKFLIANRIWVDQSLVIQPDFSLTMSQSYKSGIQITDIAHRFVEVTKLINTWVAYNTNDMIKDLLGPNALNESTKLVLVNAIYFDGEWKYKFEKESTYKQDFTKADKNIMPLDMMHQTIYNAKHHVSEDKAYQAIVLPYKGGKFDMIIALPDDIDGINSLKLTTDEIEQIESSEIESTVVLTLPKFKIESDIQETTKALKDMGMQTAFTSNADFTDIANDSALHIGSVVHKAIIEVDEAGTKAAAASAVIMESNSIPSPDDIRFTADHPFAFALVHHESRAIMFAGQFLGQ